jgi:hypothetical protein
MNNMPLIDLTKCNLTPFELSIAKIAIKGEKEVGQLRASKPKAQKQTVYTQPIYDEKHSELHEYVSSRKTPNMYATEEERIKAFGCYVWRELAFIMSPISAHHCMPVCNDFNLEYTSFDMRRKEQLAMLNNIVDKIYKSVPPHLLHGLKRWKNALGY